MDSNKVGQFILKLRKDNNLTQGQFADMFGVTPQAVSKWENGKNIPDIMIIKEICHKFSIDINEILDGKKESKKKKRNIYFLIALIVTLILVMICFWYFYQSSNQDDFHFKTITSNCEHFTILGNMAYNRSRSHLYISRIEYCGGTEPTEFIRIDARLYQSNGNVNTMLDSITKSSEEGLKLEEFLQDVNFHIEDFNTACPTFHESEIFLQIFATDKEERVTSYTVPITANPVCPNH